MMSFFRTKKKNTFQIFISLLNPILNNIHKLPSIKILKLNVCKFLPCPCCAGGRQKKQTRAATLIFRLGSLGKYFYKPLFHYKITKVEKSMCQFILNQVCGANLLCHQVQQMPNLLRISLRNCCDSTITLLTNTFKFFLALLFASLLTYLSHHKSLPSDTNKVRSLNCKSRHR